LEDNLFEPNPVWKKYWISMTFIEHSIKKRSMTVDRTTS
jgi:hypothetical protein